MSTRGRTAAERRRLTRRRAKRARTRRVIIGTVIGVTVTAAVLGMIGLITARGPEGGYCITETETFPVLGVGGWRGEQLENAATIIRTAQSLGFERDGQILGVMAAMGESSLRNIDYGDWETSGITNPDGSRTSSIGLFQQQDWWGSVEERMDPASAATLFYDRLARLPGWQGAEPLHAIHRVQINSDPEHYARFADDAAAVVDALSGPCPADSPDS